MYHEYRKIRAAARRVGIANNQDLIARNRNCRILVILHLFYPESWGEIREYLLNLACYHPHILITYPEEQEERIRALDITPFTQMVDTGLPLVAVPDQEQGGAAPSCEAADIEWIPRPNAGYDVAPFLYALQHVDLTQYDIVYKIQSKGVNRRIFIYDQLFLGRDWFVNLFEGILGADSVHKAIDALMSDLQTAIVAAENLIVPDPSYKAEIVREGLAEYGVNVLINYQFVAGTCLAISSAYLQAFLHDIESMHIEREDFQPMDASRGLSLAHLLERYLCIDAQMRGLKMQGIPVCGFRRSLRRPMEAMCRRFSSLRLLELPYHIDAHYFLWQLDNQFVLYRLRKIRLSQLQYFYPNPPQLLSMERFFPYRYLEGDTEAYAEYCRFHAEHGLPVMSAERYDALIRSIEENGYNEQNIILITEFDTILDGQHRACWLAHHYGLDHEVTMLEVSILNKRRALEEIIPRPLRIYLEKRYLRNRCIAHD